MIGPRHTLAIAAVLASAALLAACGSKTIDPKAVENQIATSKDVKDAGWAVSDPHCPSGQPAKKGATFHCTIKFNGVQVDYTATIDSVSSNKAHVTTKATELIFDVKKYSDSIAQAAGQGWTVDCGPPIQQLKAGTEVTCSAKNGADSETVKLKVDDSGNLNVETPNGSTPVTVPSDTTTIA